MTGLHLKQGWGRQVAGLNPCQTTRREAAAWGGIEQVRRQALDGFEFAPADLVQARDRTQQAGGIRMTRVRESIFRRPLLGHACGIHHIHAIGITRHDTQIVGDDYHGNTEVAR